VSPSWREQVTITLSLQRVTLERYARGLRPRRKDSKRLGCAAGTSGRAWQPALDALREALTHPNMAPADATVVLSNAFVRYLLLPWNPAIVTAQEEAAFAQARFQQVFGDAAQGWVVRLSPARPGAPVVACALERTLLDALTALIDGSALRLRSLRPSLMALCNARARLPAGDAWIAVAEAGRLLIAAVRAGEWASLRSRALNGHTPRLGEIIDQEALLLGFAPGSEKIYVHADDDAGLDLGGLKVHAWLPAGSTP
jgi:hypothetical protein